MPESFFKFWACLKILKFMQPMHAAHKLLQSGSPIHPYGSALSVQIIFSGSFDAALFCLCSFFVRFPSPVTGSDAGWIQRQVINIHQSSQPSSFNDSWFVDHGSCTMDHVPWIVYHGSCITNPLNKVHWTRRFNPDLQIPYSLFILNMVLLQGTGWQLTAFRSYIYPQISWPCGLKLKTDEHDQD